MKRVTVTIEPRPTGWNVYGNPDVNPDGTPRFVPAPGRAEWALARLLGCRDMMSYALRRHPDHPIASLLMEASRRMSKPATTPGDWGYIIAATIVITNGVVMAASAAGGPVAGLIARNVIEMSAAFTFLVLVFAWLFQRKGARR